MTFDDARRNVEDTDEPTLEIRVDDDARQAAELRHLVESADDDTPAGMPTESLATEALSAESLSTDAATAVLPVVGDRATDTYPVLEPGVVKPAIDEPAIGESAGHPADVPSSDDIVDVRAAAHDRGMPSGMKGRGREAEHPLQIPRHGWRDIAWRVKDEWGDDHVGLSAAAVAFYSFLSLIPGLAAMVSLLGLIARERNPEEVISDLFGALPGSARELLTDQLTALTEQSSGSLSIGLVSGLVLSLWTASGAIGQLIKTINIAYDEEETRNWFVRKAMAIGLTLGAIAFVALAVFVVVGFPAVIESTGLGIGTRRLLNILIWPALAISFGFALAILYRVSPDRRAARWRWVSVGSVFAILSWVLVTLGFRIYVSRFGSYNETYGSLAAVVVIMLWMYLTAVIVLLGAEINAEIEHQTEIDTTIGGEQPMGSRGAVKADTLGVLRD